MLQRVPDGPNYLQKYFGSQVTTTVAQAPCMHGLIKVFGTCNYLDYGVCN